MRVSDFNYEYLAKLMPGNAVEISLIFRWILGPLVLGWAPNHFVLGAQLAPVSLFYHFISTFIFQASND